jgi:hypothetical protein
MLAIGHASTRPTGPAEHPGSILRPHDSRSALPWARAAGRQRPLAPRISPGWPPAPCRCLAACAAAPTGACRRADSRLAARAALPLLGLARPQSRSGAPRAARAPGPHPSPGLRIPPLFGIFELHGGEGGRRADVAVLPPILEQFDRGPGITRPWRRHPPAAAGVTSWRSPASEKAAFRRPACPRGTSGAAA